MKGAKLRLHGADVLRIKEVGEPFPLATIHQAHDIERKCGACGAPTRTPNPLEDSDPRALAWGRKIVAAVNAHDALVEACQDVMDRLADGKLRTILADALKEAEA